MFLGQVDPNLVKQLSEASQAGGLTVTGVVVVIAALGFVGLGIYWVTERYQLRVGIPKQLSREAEIRHVAEISANNARGSEANTKLAEILKDTTIKLEEIEKNNRSWLLKIQQCESGTNRNG